MATGKQQRTALLKSGRKQVTLELKDGYVWEIFADGSSGHPTYDAKEEVTLFERCLRAYQKQGYRVVEDSGLTVRAAPKKPADMPLKTWRWIQDADEVLGMWLDHDYDNYKDAILDARDLLKAPPADQPRRISRLEKMLAKATRDLQKLAARDPEMADYARGLVETGPKKKSKSKPKPKKKRALQKV